MLVPLDKNEALELFINNLKKIKDKLSSEVGGMAGSCRKLEVDQFAIIKGIERRTFISSYNLYRLCFALGLKMEQMFEPDLDIETFYLCRTSIVRQELGEYCSELRKKYKKVKESLAVHCDPKLFESLYEIEKAIEDHEVYLQKVISEYLRKLSMQEAVNFKNLKNRFKSNKIVYEEINRLKTILARREKELASLRGVSVEKLSDLKTKRTHRDVLNSDSYMRGYKDCKNIFREAVNAYKDIFEERAREFVAKDEYAKNIKFDAAGKVVPAKLKDIKEDEFENRNKQDLYAEVISLRAQLELANTEKKSLESLSDSLAKKFALLQDKMATRRFSSDNSTI